DLVKGIRNTRIAMEVPPSRKAKVYIVTEREELQHIFDTMKSSYMMLASASEIHVQADKFGIGEDAVSVVIPGASVYLPLEDLIDFEKEKERLQKEQNRLTKELARSKGMLGNDKFVSKAPREKIQEEQEKLAKYEEMMEEVTKRLVQMGEDVNK
ncbi:MAG: valine--tRNA ligase, partial [Lachnospiraceae bacterium]